MSITSRFWNATRNRDWGTAVVDVGVVALGILMALAVDEWRSNREAGVEERKYLQRMHSETVTATSNFSNRQEVRLEHLDALYKVRRLSLNMPPDERLSEFDCDTLVYSSRLAFPDVNIPVIEELAATGDISVIRDTELRAAALDFIDMRESARAQVNRWSQQMHDLPFLFPNLISVQLKSIDHPEDRDGFDLAPICDLARMRKSRKFSNALARNVANTIDTVEFMANSITPRIDHLHELLDANLGIQHP